MKAENGRFTQTKIDFSIINNEPDKRKAAYLENLLVDKWMDTKFMNKSYKIRSSINVKNRDRLCGLGAEVKGLSRYFNN